MTHFGSGEARLVLGAGDGVGGGLLGATMAPGWIWNTSGLMGLLGGKDGFGGGSLGATRPPGKGATVPVTPGFTWRPSALTIWHDPTDGQGFGFGRCPSQISGTLLLSLSKVELNGRPVQFAW